MPNYKNKRPYSGKKKTTKKKPVSFDKKVERVIDKMAEPKSMSPIIVRSIRINNNITDPALQVVSLMPQLVSGSQQGERVGNEITTKRASLYFSCHLFQQSGSPNFDPPKYIDIYIYKFKKSNNQSALQLNNMFQYGNTSIPYDSSTIPESRGMYINQDKFILKKKISKVLWNPTDTNVYARGAKNISNACSMKIDLTKYIKKKILYDDLVSNVVTNDNLYISVAFTNNDDSINATNYAAGEYDISLFYDFYDL